MEGRKKGGEKYWWAREASIGCLVHTPNQGLGLQPRYLPWPGTEPVSFPLWDSAQQTEHHWPGQVWYNFKSAYKYIIKDFANYHSSKFIHSFIYFNKYLLTHNFIPTIFINDRNFFRSWEERMDKNKAHAVMELSCEWGEKRSIINFWMVTLHNTYLKFHFCNYFQTNSWTKFKNVLIAL